MINPRSVDEARVTLKRASTELRSPAVSETLQSPWSKLERGLGVWGCPQARARVFHVRGLHPELRKQQNYKTSVFSISRTFCLMLFPTGVSGNNINQAWPKGKVFAKLCLSEPSTSGGYKFTDIFEIFKGSFLISFLRTSKQPKLTRLSYEENQINSSNGCEDENASPGRSTGLWEGTKSSSEVSDLKPKPPC